MREARVIAPSPSRQSFFSSLSIFPISTGWPNEEVSASPAISESPPSAPVAREQFIRFFRSPGSCGIKTKRRRVFLLQPRVLDDVDERPRFFDFVAARKQSRVAAHRIEQEAFVSFGARFAEGSSVMKIHLHRLDSETRAWHFRL